MPALLTFWGLFLTYAIAPFAVFAFLNRLFGSEETKAPAFLAACLGLGPLAVSGILAALLAALPGRPCSLHLWTVSGLVALMLAVSERSGLDCAKKAAFGFLRLLAEGSAALRHWRSSWPSFLLLAVLLSSLALLFWLCLALPPSGSDALMSLSVAREAYGAGELPSDLSLSGGLMVWSYMFQDQAADAGAAKFAFPAFALFSCLLALALPLRSLFDRCVAACLVLAAVFPSALLLDSSTPRLYAVLLLLFLALSWTKGSRLFISASALLAVLAALRFCKHADVPSLSALSLVFAAALAALFGGKLLSGLPRTALLLAVSLGVTLPSWRLAKAKADEFPLAFELPALPEVAIVDNSTNGRFAILGCVHSGGAPEGAFLAPFPWDFAYYAPERRCIGVDSGAERLSVSVAGRRPLSALGAAYAVLPPDGWGLPSALKRLAALSEDPAFAESVCERAGWRICRLKQASPNP